MTAYFTGDIANNGLRIEAQVIGSTEVDDAVAERIVYSRALTDAELEHMEKYLNRKYGIAVA